LNPAESTLPQDSFEVPFISITPLYCVVTDIDEIDFINKMTITRFSEKQLSFLGEDDRFTRHLHLYTPQCLLWERSSVPFEDFKLLGEELATLLEQNQIDLSREDIVRSSVTGHPSVHQYMNRLARLIRALQLYRRGRLVVGDSLFYFPVPLDLRLIVRCTDMNVDYQAIEQYRPSYEFNSTDLKAFLRFYIWLLEVNPEDYPEIDFAIRSYCRETAQHGDVVDLITCLESLLVREKEGITFKLSQRIANLLGTDGPSRKELFKQVKDFYDLRSKSVHGVQLKPREMKTEQQLDELREITRKAILSVIAIAAESGMGQEFPVLLNDMCFDDDLRSSMQAKAAALLQN
jgi:hypothetical protein